MHTAANRRLHSCAVHRKLAVLGVILAAASENFMSENHSRRVIKKYPNRRLYDTSESKYVTLADVRKLVLADIPFAVIDNKSGDDITRSILLQIIIEQEESGEPIFSTDILQQLISFYGNSMQSVAGDYLRNSLGLIYEQQKRLQEQMTDAMQYSPMPSAFNEVAKRNMEVWQKWQESFLKAGGIIKNSDETTD